MEQTDSKRFRAHVPVIFARDGQPGEARGFVYNLSNEGCKITSDTRMTPGTYVTLKLFLPNPHALTVIRLAVVRWTQGWDFGVTFLHVQNDEFQRLNQYLASLETVDTAS